MSVHEQKWTDTQEKKGCCISLHDTKRKKIGCMSVHEQKWTDPKKKKKKFEDEVTLSHVGKSTTQSRWIKYLKNGTLIEDYNES